VIVPFVFGWLALGGQRAGFYGPQFGVTLLTLSSIAVLAGFVWWSAAALDRLDVARRGADEALRRGYDDLGGLIAQRTSALHASQVDVRAEISGRVRSEAQAKSHQERVRKILETAYDGFVALDQSGVIVEWNRQAEEMFGWPREEMLGRSFADAVIPEPQRAAHVEELRRFLESGDGPTRNKRLQLYVARRDGHEFPVELTVWATMAEDTYTFSAFIHDISERTQAEMLNARLVAIVQYSGDAILAMSPLGEILSWNTAAQRLYGYAADEVVGRSVSMLTPPAGRDDIKDLLSHVAEGAPSQQCETTHATKARGLIEVSLSLSPIRDASGRLLGVSGIIRDVTEQRRADAAHRETEKLRFVAQLANAASHEINNPLTVIAAQMVMMEQEYERDEQSQKRFERIDEALKRIRDISARLRHLSRLEVADGAPGGSEMLDLTKSSPPDDVPSAPDR
jgi:PAS domain S-box-containing protein